MKYYVDWLSKPLLEISNSVGISHLFVDAK
jgi:hypothetical protein